MARRESSRHSTTFIGAQLVKLAVNTTVMLMIKNSVNERSIRFVVLPDLKNFLGDGVVMVLQKVFCKAGRVRFFGSFIA